MQGTPRAKILMWNYLDVFPNLQGNSSTRTRRRGAQQLGGRGEQKEDVIGHGLERQ